MQVRGVTKGRDVHPFTAVCASVSSGLLVGRNGLSHENWWGAGEVLAPDGSNLEGQLHPCLPRSRARDEFACDIIDTHTGEANPTHYNSLRKKRNHEHLTKLETAHMRICSAVALSSILPG